MSLRSLLRQHPQLQVHLTCLQHRFSRWRHLAQVKAQLAHARLIHQAATSELRTHLCILTWMLSAMRQISEPQWGSCFLSRVSRSRPSCQISQKIHLQLLLQWQALDSPLWVLLYMRVDSASLAHGFGSLKAANGVLSASTATCAHWVSCAGGRRSASLRQKS